MNQSKTQIAFSSLNNCSAALCILCDACTSVYIVNSVGCVTPSSLSIHALKQIKLYCLLGIVTEGTAKYRSLFPGGEGENCKAVT